MNTSVKYIVQFCNDETGEIIKEEVLKTKSVVFPKTLSKFGLRHKEQIELIKKSQDFLIKIQSKFFEDQKKCPQCGKNTRKQGEIESEFHDVYTDHKIIIQRLTCACGWKNKYTINGIYGNASHPELVELQATTGSNNSFEKASKILDAFSCGQRSINNNVTIMRNVNKVGKLLEQHKKSGDWMNPLKQAKELIIVTDGGHVQDRAANHHSFEEIISTIYNPDFYPQIKHDNFNIKYIDRGIKYGKWVYC